METQRVRQFHALLKKELLVKFRSSLPLWGMGFLQLGMAAWMFWIYGFFQRGLADLEPFFRMLTTAFTVLLPLYASWDVPEERKSLNWDLLHSFPLSTFRILLVKFLANTVWLSIHLFQIGFLLIPVLSFGDFDRGMGIGALVGLGFYGTLILSMGQWVSTSRKGSLLSYLITIGILLSLLILPFWAGKLPRSMHFLRILSIPHHLDGFFRGMILAKDLGFFLGGVAFFWILSGGLRRIHTVSSLLLVILIVWGMSSLPGGLDLTQRKIYTISIVSRRVLAGLESNIRISYYVSDPLFLRSAQPERIVERLTAYSAGMDKVNLRIEDPSRTGEARQLVLMGLRTDAEGFFSGITLEYKDEMEVIPWIAEAGNVEYLLTTHILRLVAPSTRTIGILQGDSYERESEGLYPLLKATGFVPIMNQELNPLPSISTLLVLHGEGLSEQETEFLRQYIEKGGKALVFVDRVKVDREQNLKASLYPSSGIHDLLQRMGMTVSPTLVLDRSSLSLPVQRGEGTETERFYLPYPPWPRVRGDGFNREHPITVGLSTFDLFWASPLVIHPVPGVRATILARTGLESWLVGDPFPTDPFAAPSSILRGVDRKGSYPVIVLLETGSGKLIVVGDSQCMGDLVDSTKSYENFSFLVNALEWLTDPAGPLKIRNRFLRDSLLEAGVEKHPAVQLLYRVHLFLLPGLILGGMVGQRIRKKRRSG